MVRVLLSTERHITGWPVGGSHWRVVLPTEPGAAAASVDKEKMCKNRCRTGEFRSCPLMAVGMGAMADELGALNTRYFAGNM